MNCCKLIISFLLFLTLPVIAIAGQYKVIRIVDGDTIVINYNGEYEKVRKLCVNTPESVLLRQSSPTEKVSEKNSA